MIYMNHCTTALKKLREESRRFLEQQRSKSNARVKSLKKPSGSQGEDQSKVKRSATHSSKMEAKKRKPANPAVPASSSKVWSDLESELQATFFQKDTGTTQVSESPTSNKSRSATLKEDTASVNKVSNFYSKTKIDISADNARKKEHLVSKSSREKQKEHHSEKRSHPDKSLPTPLLGKPVPTPLLGKPVPTPLLGKPVPTPLVGKPVPTPLVDKTVPTPLLETTSDLASELFGDSDSDNDTPMNSTVQHPTLSTAGQGSNTKIETTSDVSVKEQQGRRRLSSGVRPASPFLDSNVDFIRVFGSDSSDNDTEQTFESALASLDSLNPSKYQPSHKKKSKPIKKDKSTRTGKRKHRHSEKSTKRSTHGNKERDKMSAPDYLQLSSTSRINDVVDLDPDPPVPCGQDSVVATPSTLERRPVFVNSPSSPFAKVPMLKLIRAVSVTKSPSSSCSSPGVKLSPDIASSLLSPDPPPLDISSANIIDMADDVVFHVDDLCTQPEEQTCHSTMEITSTRHLDPPSTSAQPSSSTSTVNSSIPSFLPSGPFINLTKVADKQKQKVTSMVSYAREKGSKTSVRGGSRGGEKVGVAKGRPSVTILKKKEIVMTREWILFGALTPNTRTHTVTHTHTHTCSHSILQIHV